MSRIPIVDLAECGIQHDEGTADQPTVQRVIKELDSAFSKYGFVYLINHGIEKDAIDKFFQISKNFFNLPPSVKEKYPRCMEDRNIQGYFNSIKSPNQRKEIREFYEMSWITPESTFPDEDLPEFRISAQNLGNKFICLTNRLLKLMALALGINEDFFSSRHQSMLKGTEKTTGKFQSMHYPPIEDEDLKAGLTRIHAHADFLTITLLLQDDMGGLEVLCGDEWIPATPVPGAILINIGQVMQLWTSNRYIAPMHRVVVPEEEIRRKTGRQSVAVFVGPDNNVMLSPLDASDDTVPSISAPAFNQMCLTKFIAYIKGE